MVLNFAYALGLLSLAGTTSADFLDVFKGALTCGTCHAMLAGLKKSVGKFGQTSVLNEITQKCKEAKLQVNFLWTTQFLFNIEFL